MGDIGGAEDADVHFVSRGEGGLGGRSGMGGGGVQHRLSEG